MNIALRWYTKAAEQGHVLAQFNIASSLFLWTRHRAERRHGYELVPEGRRSGPHPGAERARVDLRSGPGRHEESGRCREVVSRKPPRAGWPWHSTIVASMYELGEGVTQDYVKAAEWYEKSAEQGYGMAQVSLGTLYHQGKGVAQDLVKAHMWYNLAASKLKDGKHKDRAVKNRDTITKHMNPVQTAKAKQMAEDWKYKGK